MPHTFVPPIPQAPGYATVRRIGHGGMGEVYVGRARDGDALVAIKFLTPAPESRRNEQAMRFAREARVVAGLEHPNIVAVFAAGTSDGRKYFVMEFVFGGSLRQWLAPGRPVAIERARAALRQIARALDYLHQKGIVHRDLKPENVLLDAAGQVKLADFGISSPLVELGAVTTSGQFVGTLDYMAPEQRGRLAVDARADQFSLAVIAYELFTGKRPLGRFKPPSQLNRRLGRDLDAVILKSLEEDPDDRFASVAELAAALEQALDRSPWPRRTTLAAWATCAVLVCVTSLFAVSARRQRIGLVAGNAVSVEDDIESADEPSNPPLARADESESDAGAASRPASLRIAEPPKDRSTEVAYFLELAERHVAAGLERDAEIAFTEAVRLTPQDSEPLLNRALFYKKVGFNQKSLDDLSEVIRLDPTRTEARYARGTIFVRLKDFARAVAELDEAIRLEPNLASAFAYRGWAHHGMRNDRLAEVDLNRAVELDADCSLTFHFRGMWLNARKDFAAAAGDFERQVQLAPDDPFAHQALALLLANCADASLRDGPRAVTHARMACELTRWRDWSQIRTLATAYSAAGDLDEAIRWCETALTTAPELSQRGLREQLDGYRKRKARTGETPP